MSDTKELRDAIDKATAARNRLDQLLAAESPRDLEDYYSAGIRRLLDEQILLQWKSLIAPIVDRLETELAKAERDRDELIRRAARRLP